jgi:hypothetical protein
MAVVIKGVRESTLEKEAKPSTIKLNINLNSRQRHAVRKGTLRLVEIFYWSICFNIISLELKSWEVEKIMVG